MKKGTIAKTLAVLATLSLSSCSNPFFGGNEEFMITDIATRVDAATGDTIVTITFSDDPSRRIRQGRRRHFQD